MNNYKFEISKFSAQPTCTECQKKITDILLDENALASLNDKYINKFLNLIKYKSLNINLIIDDEVKIKLLKRP